MLSELTANEAVLTAVHYLVYFALWPIVLVFIIAFIRVGKVITAGASPDDFPSGVKHGSDPYWRLNRAHMNIFESLPIFAVMVFGGIATGAIDDQFALLCRIALAARIVQTLAHLSSGSVLAVNVRFLGLGVQLVCFILMALAIL